MAGGFLEFANQSETVIIRNTGEGTTLYKFNYPEEAALAYYIFLDKDQPADMYALLTEPQASQTPQKALEDLSRTLGSVAGDKDELQLKLSQQITQG